MSRAARLLHLLDALRQRRVAVPGPTLARELGVSLRTLYRDIATLRQQGATIEGDPGVGYLMKPGLLLPPLMFSPDELEALVLGARWVAGQSADPELAHAAHSAVQRIASVLPTTLRLTVETSGLLVPGPRQTPAPAPWLPALRHAIRAEQVLQLHYRDQSGTVTLRRIWPFALAFFDHARLIAAWCELRHDFRHFRADRVVQLTATGQRCPERRHALLRRWRTHMGLDAQPTHGA